ncbi:uncharacterized protein C3orf38 homolog [Haliotis rufescens]|uniref:uncharacterized protein C3orf38 homolog n=1 Tax=Haliotis rufescens TaxID=6454 RepID=UPI00201F3C16|nr:uncharacterized protein C3orf38 homolog [Haliotis rufescens]
MKGVEKKGCEAILRKLDQEEVMSLKDTVTKRQIAAENKTDAIRAIITYSETSGELLRRKKIRRELLFQYLDDNNVPVSVNAEKHQLILKILEYWGVSVSNGTQNKQANSAGGDFSHSTTECQTDVPSRTSSGTQSPPPDAAAKHSMATQAGETPPDTQMQLRQQHQPVPVPVPLVLDLQEDEASSVVVPPPAAAMRLQPQPEHQKLGETFVSWFYKILNSHNPSLNQVPEDFGPHHFWNDVKLYLLTRTPHESSEEYEGGVLVSQRFLALVKEEQLLFNPNVTGDGVQVKSDPHGLVIIMVCGTIHRSNDCLGVFQQMFGLIGDPRYDNNWKVKVTKLRIQSSQVTSIPRLQDSDNNDLLAVIPSSTR